MVRKMKKSDWARVSEIYKQALETGVSTFNTECPTYNEWDENHLKNCRFVYAECDKVLGWIALSATSSRKAYSGVVEVSIYVDKETRQNGIGKSLMNKLKQEAKAVGYWSLYSVILSVNEDSIIFHKKCGFREIGYKEKPAKDKFGNWQNTVLMEYRFPEI